MYYCNSSSQKSREKFGGSEYYGYICSVNLKQEFGKWFLDVAKYVITAMLLTSMIEGMSQTWIVATTAALSILCLVFGAILMQKGRDEEDRRERNRQRHRVYEPHRYQRQLQSLHHHCMERRLVCHHPEW